MEKNLEAQNRTSIDISSTSTAEINTVAIGHAPTLTLQNVNTNTTNLVAIDSVTPTAVIDRVATLLQEGFTQVRQQQESSQPSTSSPPITVITNINGYISFNGQQPSLPLASLHDDVTFTANLRFALQKRYTAYQQLPQMFAKTPNNDREITNCFINLALLKQEHFYEKEQHLEKKNVTENPTEIHSWVDERIENHEKLYQFTTQQAIDLKNLFSPLPQEQQAPKRVLIYGRAGIGKTVLCQYLASQHGNNPDILASFTAVFLLPLRLVAMDLAQESNQNITARALLLDILCNHCLTGNTWQNQKIALSLWLNQHANNILFILDGFDEIGNINARKLTLLFDSLINDTDFEPAILLTSRPMSIDSMASFYTRFDRKLECMGFSNQDIATFINKSFSKTNDSKTFLAYLMQYPSIWGIAHIPLYLELLCWCWHQGTLQQTSIKPSTLSQLYSFIIEEIVEKNQQSRRGLKAKLTDNDMKEAIDWAALAQRFLAWLAYQTQRDADELKETQKLSGILINNIKEYAEEYLKQFERELFKKGKREQLIIKAEFIQHLISVCAENGLGLLKSITASPGNREKHTYYFLHLSLKEYFAAVYYANQFLVSAMSETVISTELLQHAHAVIDWFKKNKYVPHYQWTWRLIAGLLYQQAIKRNKREQQQGQIALNNFFATLQQQPLDWIGIHHHNLTMQCLEECLGDETILVLQDKIDRVITTIRNQSKERDWLPTLWDKTLETCPHLLKTERFANLFLALLEEQRLYSPVMMLILPHMILTLPRLEKIVAVLMDEDVDSKVRCKLIHTIAKKSFLKEQLFFNVIDLLKKDTISIEIRKILAHTVAARKGLSKPELDCLIGMVIDKNIRQSIRRSLIETLAKHEGLIESHIKSIIEIIKNDNILEEIRDSLAQSLATNKTLTAKQVDKLFALLTEKNVSIAIKVHLAQALVIRNELSEMRIEQFFLLLAAEDNALQIHHQLVQFLADYPSLTEKQFSYLTSLLKGEDSRKNEYNYYSDNQDLRIVIAQRLAARTELTTKQLELLLLVLEDPEINSNVSHNLATTLAERQLLSDTQFDQLYSFISQKINHFDACKKLVYCLAERHKLKDSQFNNLFTILTKIVNDKYACQRLAIILAKNIKLTESHFINLVNILKETDYEYYRCDLATALAERSNLSEKQINLLCLLLTEKTIRNETRIALMKSLITRSIITDFNFILFIETLAKKEIAERSDNSFASILLNRSQLTSFQFACTLDVLKDESIQQDIRLELLHALISHSNLAEEYIEELYTLLIKNIIVSDMRVDLACCLASHTTLTEKRFSYLVFLLKNSPSVQQFPYWKLAQILGNSLAITRIQVQQLFAVMIDENSSIETRVNLAQALVTRNEFINEQFISFFSIIKDKNIPFHPRINLLKAIAKYQKLEQEHFTQLLTLLYNNDKQNPQHNSNNSLIQYIYQDLIDTLIMRIKLNTESFDTIINIFWNENIRTYLLDILLHNPDLIIAHVNELCDLMIKMDSNISIALALAIIKFTSLTENEFNCFTNVLKNAKSNSYVHRELVKALLIHPNLTPSQVIQLFKVVGNDDSSVNYSTLILALEHSKLNEDHINHLFIGLKEAKTIDHEWESLAYTLAKRPELTETHFNYFISVIQDKNIRSYARENLAQILAARATLTEVQLEQCLALVINQQIDIDIRGSLACTLAKQAIIKDNHVDQLLTLLEEKHIPTEMVDKLTEALITRPSLTDQQRQKFFPLLRAKRVDSYNYGSYAYSSYRSYTTSYIREKLAQTLAKSSSLTTLQFEELVGLLIGETSLSYYNYHHKDFRKNLTELLITRVNLTQAHTLSLIRALKNEEIRTEIRIEIIQTIAKQLSLAEELLEQLFIVLKEEKVDIKVRKVLALQLFERPDLTQAHYDHFIIIIRDYEEDKKEGKQRCSYYESPQYCLMTSLISCKELTKKQFECFIKILRNEFIQNEIVENLASSLASHSKLSTSQAHYLYDLLAHKKISNKIYNSLACALAARPELTWKQFQFLIALLADITTDKTLCSSLAYRLANRAKLSEIQFQALITIVKKNGDDNETNRAIVTALGTAKDITEEQFDYLLDILKNKKISINVRNCLKQALLNSWSLNNCHIKQLFFTLNERNLINEIYEDLLQILVRKLEYKKLTELQEKHLFYILNNECLSENTTENLVKLLAERSALTEKHLEQLYLLLAQSSLSTKVRGNLALSLVNRRKITDKQVEQIFVFLKDLNVDTEIFKKIVLIIAKHPTLTKKQIDILFVPLTIMRQNISEYHFELELALSLANRSNLSISHLDNFIIFLNSLKRLLPSVILTSRQEPHYCSRSYPPEAIVLRKEREGTIFASWYQAGRFQNERLNLSKQIISSLQFPSQQEQYNEIDLMTYPQIGREILKRCNYRFPNYDSFERLMETLTKRNDLPIKLRSLINFFQIRNIASESLVMASAKQQFNLLMSSSRDDLHRLIEEGYIEVNIEDNIEQLLRHLNLSDKQFKRLINVLGQDRLSEKFRMRIANCLISRHQLTEKQFDYLIESLGNNNQVHYVCQGLLLLASSRELSSKHFFYVEQILRNNSIKIDMRVKLAEVIVQCRQLTKIQIAQLFTILVTESIDIYIRKVLALNLISHPKLSKSQIEELVALLEKHELVSQPNCQLTQILITRTQLTSNQFQYLINSLKSNDSNRRLNEEIIQALIARTELTDEQLKYFVEAITDYKVQKDSKKIIVQGLIKRPNLSEEITILLYTLLTNQRASKEVYELLILRLATQTNITEQQFTCLTAAFDNKEFNETNGIHLAEILASRKNLLEQQLVHLLALLTNNTIAENIRRKLAHSLASRNDLNIRSLADENWAKVWALPTTAMSNLLFFTWFIRHPDQFKQRINDDAFIFMRFYVELVEFSASITSIFFENSVKLLLQIGEQQIELLIKKSVLFELWALINRAAIRIGLFKEVNHESFLNLATAMPEAIAVYSQAFTEMPPLEAIQQLLLLITLVEQDSHLNFYAKLGHIYINYGYLGQAIEAYHQALENEPNCTEIYHNLACCYYMLEQLELADTHFLNGIKMAINSAILAEYAHFLFQQAEYGKTIRYCQQCLEQIEDEDLYYGITEAEIIVTSLKQFINQNNGLIISAQGLAYYLTIRCHQQLNQATDEEIAVSYFERWIKTAKSEQKEIWSLLFAEIKAFSSVIKSTEASTSNQNNAANQFLQQMIPAGISSLLRDRGFYKVKSSSTATATMTMKNNKAKAYYLNFLS